MNYQHVFSAVDRRSLASQGAIVAALAGVFASALNHARAQFITPIGWSCIDIPSGCTPTCVPLVNPLGVNVSGQVLAAVNATPCTGNSYFFVSRYDQLPAGVGTPSISLSSSTTLPTAGGINALGQFVTSYTFPPPLDLLQAVFHDGNPGMGGPPSIIINNASANGINNFGDVTGAVFTTPDTLPQGWYSYRYFGRANVDASYSLASTPILAPVPFAEGHSINSTGQLIGAYIGNRFVREPLLNNPLPRPAGTSYDLGSLFPPTGLTIVRVINDRGQSAGWTATPFSNFPRAFRYDGTPGAGGVMQDLGTLNPPFGGSEGFGITHNGAVVGTSEIPGGSTAPFIYLGEPGAGGFMLNLDSWLESVNAVEGANWTLTSASAVSPNGWVVGHGIINGVPRAYLLDARALITPCFAPNILLQPLPSSSCPGQQATFTINAGFSQFAGVRWEWSLDGSPFKQWTTPVVRDSILLATMSGGDSTTLRVTPDASNASAGINLVVRAVVASECGVVVSDSVALTVRQPPIIDRAPVSMLTCPSGRVQLSGRIAADGPLVVSWSFTLPETGERRDVANGRNRDANENPLFVAEGADTQRLTLIPPDAVGGPRWPVAQLNGFVLRVAGSCGEIETSPVNITLCAADANCSGVVDVNDIFEFLNSWFAGLPTTDINGQGGVDVNDIFDFLNRWFSGC